MSAKDKLHNHFATALDIWKEQRDPYVWRLNLSASFYREGLSLLENAIAETGNMNFLYEKDFAPIALIMVAEWYKRDYTGNHADSPTWVKDIEWKDVWMASGLRRWERWVYQFEESGKFSWQYSAYVLGGIACRFISQQDKESRLLKDLCKLFHGQIEETEIDLSGNARALSMSIDKGGSIYHFLLDLMDDNSRLSLAYAHDGEEEVRDLRKKILEANKEVTKKKLRSEWRFTTSPYNRENLHRSLRISFAPERVDGEKRWFLSRERAQEWGLKLTDALTDINVILTLYRNGEPIDNPIEIMSFQPTGSLNAGFNIIDENPWYVVTNLPADFDGWRLSATTNDGQHKEIDPGINPVGDWTQIYQTAKNANVWSSNRRRMSTAVVFNDRCRITDPEGHPVAGKMLLVDNSPTRHINWADIPVYVKLAYPSKGGQEREEKLISPLAECRVIVGNLYPTLIHYLPGGQITVERKDTNTGEIEEEQMQMAFGLDNILLTWMENGKIPKTAAAELITTKQNGETRDIEKLKKGVVEVTAYANGMQATAKVWYIPTNGQTAPGYRDLKKRRVVWGTKKYPAPSLDSEEGLQPTITIEDRDILGNKASINVFQPAERTELWFGEKRLKILEEDTPAYVPLLSLPKITIRRFDEAGYRHWVGSEHLNEYKGLCIPSSDTRKTEIPSISIINFKESAPDRRTRIEIGGYQVERGDTQLTAPCYQKQRGEQEDDIFGGDDPFSEDNDHSLEPIEALTAAIENNLYSFYFDELFNKGGQIPSWMEEIRNKKGEEFMNQHREAILRILWENDLTTNDLNFRI